MAKRITAPAITARKVRNGAKPIVMVTAYDYAQANIVGATDADMILVGDSLAMVVLGYPDTLSVTVDDICHHTAAVARAHPKQLIVADLPWMSYHVNIEQTIQNAAKLIRAGAGAVKLEGGIERVEVVEALINTEIPVMGHVGLTPQSVKTMGGFKVQAKTARDAQDLLADARALQDAGCFSIIVEGVPRKVAAMVTNKIDLPTVGIGAGPECDGQVLVYHDVLGLQNDFIAKFVRQYANIKLDSIAALDAFVADVHSGEFPNDSESYHLNQQQAEALENEL